MTSRVRDERGETLMELMITILVIGVGMVAIVGMMGGSVVASDTHRQLASAEVIVRDFGEAIKEKAAGNAGATYVACPTATDLTPSGFTVPTNWNTPTITKVEYWVPDPANFPRGSFTTTRATCTSAYTACDNPGLSACDVGYQRVTFNVNNTGKVTQDYLKTDVTSRVLTRRSNGE